MNKACILFIALLTISFSSVAQTKTVNAGGIEMRVSSADTSLSMVF